MMVMYVLPNLVRAYSPPTNVVPMIAASAVPTAVPISASGHQVDLWALALQSSATIHNGQMQ